MTDETAETPPLSANDNPDDEARAAAIPFTDLAAALGLDEDTLLMRFAEILARREEQPE